MSTENVFWFYIGFLDCANDIFKNLKENRGKCEKGDCLEKSWRVGDLRMTKSMNDIVSEQEEIKEKNEAKISQIEKWIVKGKKNCRSITIKMINNIDYAIKCHQPWSGLNSMSGADVKNVGKKVESEVTYEKKECW